MIIDEILNILDAEFNLPNVKWPVVDGGIFWTDLVKYKNWRLQQNSVSKSARILDENNYRIAWGTVNGMRKILDRRKELEEKYH